MSVMGQLLIITMIGSLIITLLMVPITRKVKNRELTMKQWSSLTIIVFIVSVIFVFVTVYLSKIDLNWTILLYALPVIALFGAIFAVGFEQKIKSLLVLVGIIGVAYLLSAPLLNADEKYNSAEMSEDIEISPFDETKTPASVPPKFVKNKMKKAFGQVPNTSYYELGNLQIQKVNGEYVYIAPVEFSGFFKWLNGKTTPGYFTMSATDSSDNPKFIQSEMSYIPSAFLNKNLERHIRLQHPTLIFYGDPQLEIDEDGKPFYIRSYGEFISGRNGFDVKGIVLVDASTGDTEKVALADVPEFIDGAVSPETVSLQNSYFGNYVHGFWNSVIGKKDVKLPSDEGTEANVSPIFMEDGQMYYFTDFTSPKEGVDSMLGYALTNARTGEATYYSGNLEESYMDSQGALQIIEKKFVEKEWEGEMPILYNFYGEASWLSAVLDANGFLQNYFIVSAANPEISAFATTPNEALKLYKTALSRGGSTVDGTSNAEEAKAGVEVVRVYKERVGDFTIVSFLTATGENFIVSSGTVPLAIYLQEGDRAVITYAKTGEQFQPVKAMVIQGLQ
jgi:prepilin signal peptidase PulO-like enzyme (type II secretory pathway)